MAEQIKLIFSTEATVGSSTPYWERIWVSCLHKYDHWNIALNSRLGKHSLWHVNCHKCHQFSSTNDRHQLISRWASTFVYKVTGTTQCVAWIHLHQLSLVY